MTASFINTLATLPLQHHTELGLLMSFLCLCFGMLLVLFWQQLHEVQLAPAASSYRYEKASWVQYIQAVKVSPKPCSIDDLLADILN